MTFHSSVHDQRGLEGFRLEIVLHLNVHVIERVQWWAGVLYHCHNLGHNLGDRLPITNLCLGTSGSQSRTVPSQSGLWKHMGIFFCYTSGMIWHLVNEPGLLNSLYWKAHNKEISHLEGHEHPCSDLWSTPLPAFWVCDLDEVCLDVSKMVSWDFLYLAVNGYHMTLLTGGLPSLFCIESEKSQWTGA